jgi:hypothetical protein
MDTLFICYDQTLYFYLFVQLEDLSLLSTTTMPTLFWLSSHLWTFSLSWVFYSIPLRLHSTSSQIICLDHRTFIPHLLYLYQQDLSRPRLLLQLTRRSLKLEAIVRCMPNKCPLLPHSSTSVYPTVKCCLPSPPPPPTRSLLLASQKQPLPSQPRAAARASCCTSRH